MANMYYIHQSVKNPQEASIFSDRYTWTILDLLRAAGSNGLSPTQVHQAVEKKLPPSISSAKIYNILKRLYEMNWVHRIYNKDDKTHHSIANLEWGAVFLDKTYDEIIVKNEKEYITQRIIPIFKEYLKRTIENLEKNKNTKKWLPEQNTCKICQISHEAEEFVNSILDVAVAEFMVSDEYKQFMIDHHFKEKEE
jgi:Fe2+ or Zn2+ uptake regulation protein